MSSNKNVSNIEKRIEKRIKKLETKIKVIKDNYEEMDNNLENIYDTINNFNSRSSESRNESRSESRYESNSNSNSNCDKQIIKYINKCINKISLTNKSKTKNKNKNTYRNETEEDEYEEDEYESRTEFGTESRTEFGTESGTGSESEDEIKNKIILFYNKLIQNQPQLSDESIKEHINYFIEKDTQERNNILDNLDKVFDITDTKTPKLFKILNSTLAPYQKKIALCKLQTLETMKQKDSSASDYFKMSQWLDTFLEIPFNVYKTPSYMDSLCNSNPSKYLIDSRQHLDTVIYGQDKTKQHIIEILARMIQNPKTLGSVFAIYGEAGTGKTTLIKDGLSHIFGLPFVFISLGGAQDRATLAGSNYVYEGSSCGKIIQSLKQSQCMNPIFYFDELDKTSGTEKGNEIINLLIHLTDYTQNSHFMDDYMDGIAIDLSRATFIFSFNDKNKISPILLDRMEIIKFNSYSNKEKMVIARDFLLPSVVKNVFNDDNIEVVISDENMRRIVFGDGGPSYGGPSYGGPSYGGPSYGGPSYGGPSYGGPSPQYPLVPAYGGPSPQYPLEPAYGGPSPQYPLEPAYGGPSPQYPLVPAGSLKKKRFGKTGLKFGKIMKKVSRVRNGGVRYIKKILERIVSRVNLQLFQKKPCQKQDLKNKLIVSDKIVNEILEK